MTELSRELRALTLALLVGLSPLTLAVVPAVATGGNDHANEPDTEPYDGAYTPGAPFAVTQGSQCVAVEALGDGTRPVEDAYKYRKGPEGSYSAYGFSDLQVDQGSQLFLYEGTEGTSLVMLHDRLDGYDGGVVTFDFSGLPTDDPAEWVVRDDMYDGPANYDRWDIGGSSATIDWTWQARRTDGATFAGMEDGDYDAVTLSPGFNEDAHFWGSDIQGGTTDELTSWTLRGGAGETHQLDMTEPVSIRRGTCNPDSPTARLSAHPGTVEPGASVQFDAAGSDDADGIAAYHWDFDGDGDVDDSTSEPTAAFQYADVGDYVASVTVEDRTGRTDTASTTVAVAGEPAPVTAALSVDSTTPRTGQALTFDASGSAGPIAEYRWSFDDGAGTTTSEPRTTHSFDSAGTYDVTVTVVGDDGQTATAHRTVEVTPAATPARPPSANADAGHVTMGFVAHESENARTVRYYNPPTDEGFTATLGGGDEPVALHALTVVPSRSVDRFDLTMRELEAAPTNEAIPQEDALAYLQLEGSDVPYERGTLTFSVARDRLNQSGATPDDVAALRPANGSWEPIETSEVGSNEDRIWYSADVPYGTPVALAVTPGIQIESVDRDYTVFLEEELTVAVTVSNAGSVPVTDSMTFDNVEQQLDTATVALAPGERTTITWTHSFDSNGLHTLHVNDREVKVLVFDGPPLNAD